MKSYEENIALLEELQPHTHWAAKRWLDDCLKKNRLFDVIDVHRTQKEQDERYALGRWLPGKKVTWTLNSKHTQRLACDILTINCSYAQVEEIAIGYGITRPLAGAPYYDEGHFEFDHVPSFPIILSGTYLLKSLQRRLERVGVSGRVLVQNTINRLLRRTSQDHS